MFIEAKVDGGGGDNWTTTDGLNTDLHLEIGNGISLEFCYLGDTLDAIQQ